MNKRVKNTMKMYNTDSKLVDVSIKVFNIAKMDYIFMKRVKIASRLFQML